eukprot:CAMPEP_0181234192 /NCGR_PEP_ID=MMETSP1096-20121128/36808_1 /TAXON_ID=156174 ORGANISM="Chrysochromulina ericina, Strain CCMP281" /NCGR_SAMPLE_ID=MMETSP1096 /ASSEMBLY_ACC=CAM_ASM_000453 /LENGTH=90 /DNA_ID=CAMNT_0023328883 /DNA_START=147 /DNA_END=416 /DNA_ORIENTATION=+
MVTDTAGVIPRLQDAKVAESLSHPLHWPCRRGKRYFLDGYVVGVRAQRDPRATVVRALEAPATKHAVDYGVGAQAVVVGAERPPLAQVDG